MLSFIAALALAAPPIEQPPRLRTILANGSVVLVAPDFRAKSITIELVASSRGSEETTATHGWRHLLEHLLVKGREGKLDALLESQGGFLRAQTYRDAMAIEFDVPPDKLSLGLEGVAEVLHFPETSDSAIAKEVSVLKQELALTDDTARFGNAGWSAAYGEQGLDPLGEPEKMSMAKAQDILDLYIRHFRSSNLALVISGPVDIDSGTKAATALLERLPGSQVKGKPRIRQAAPKAATTADAEGAAVSIVVPPYDSPTTAATLAAALAFASDQDGCFVTYTASTQPGLLTVGRAGSAEILEPLMKQDAGDVDSLYAIGVRLAKAWLDSQVSSSRNAAAFRGLLLAQDTNATPERMATAMNAITLPEFRAAFESLKHGILIRGSR